MTSEDVTALEAVLAYLQGIEPGSALLLILILIAGAAAWRIARGSSFKELLGSSNGYLRQREFDVAVNDLRERLDRQHAAIVKLQERVGELEMSVASLEQYRD